MQKAHSAFFRLLALLAVAALIAAGCGDDDDSADDSAGSDDSAEADADADESASDDVWPVEIEHRHGTTVIDGPAERVVSLGLRDVDAVLALGVVPVGIQEWFGGQPDAVWPWAHDLLQGEKPTVLDSSEIAFETIAALQPDLIVAIDSGLDASDYELLSQIAPTVAPPVDSVDFAVPWRERTLMVGEALGKRDEAEALIADVEAAIDEARSAHPELDGATALVGLANADGQAYAYGSADVRSQLLVELGLTIPDHIESQIPEGDFYVALSAENLDQMDADVVLWVGAQESLDAMLDQPVYPSHLSDAGRDLMLPYEPYGGAMSYASVLSLPFLVEDLVPELVLALDGDPDTRGDLAPSR